MEHRLEEDDGSKSHVTQWASLNLARLQLSFCQREQATSAIQEAVRSAQQQEDNVCLAYALLWIYHTQVASPSPHPDRIPAPTEPSPSRQP